MMQQTLKTTVAGILAGLLLTAGVGAQTLRPPDEFAIRNVRIFDGSSVISSGTVWIKDGKIEAAGPHVEVPPGILTIEGDGKTLLPGLIDAHVHTVGREAFLKSALALGVTTELDMGAAPQFAAKIEKEQAEGKRLDLADLRSSQTQPTAPDGHGTEYGIPIPTVSSPSDAQPLIDQLIAGGADFIGEIVYDDGSEFGLQIPTLGQETLQAVIEAAHRRGRLAVVHVLSAEAAKRAIAAGADGLAHLFTGRPPDDEFLSLAVAHHVFVIPTLSVLASMAGASAGPSLARDPRLEPYLSSEAIADLNQDVPQHAGSLSNAQQAVRLLAAEGVPILAGTDAHNPGTAHGASLHGELQLLVQSGLTPAQALASATSVNAAAFRLNDRGQIAPGKRADLLLVSGDPATDISAISNVVAVWKAGVPMDREGYRAALDAEKASEEAQRRADPPPGSESGLISDFEDGTPAAMFGRGWTFSTGRLMGGHKPEGRMEVVDGGAAGSAKALRIAGSITPGVFGWAGAMFFPGSGPMSPVNLSGKSAISFWTKGDGSAYQLMLFSRSKGSMPATKSFTAGAEWQKVTIPLSDLGSDGGDLTALMFAGVALPGPFTFLIDNVRLEPKAAPLSETVDAGPPDALPPAASKPPAGRAFVRPASAPASRARSGWDVRSTSYFWLQGIHGDVSAFGKGVGFKAGPTDLASRAKLGLQDVVEVRRGRLALIGDLLWTPLEIHSSNSLVNPAPALLDKATYNPLILTPEVAYRLAGSGPVQIEALAGMRYWRLGADFTLAPAAGGATLSKSLSWFDPVVGARIKLPLSKKIAASVWGDAGGWGAGSQLEYQIVGALSYQAKPAWILDAGWRYLYSDYHDSLLHSGLAQSGLVLGVTHRFKAGKESLENSR